MLGRFAARAAKNKTTGEAQEEEKSNLVDYEKVISGAIVRADHQKFRRGDEEAHAGPTAAHEEAACRETAGPQI